MCSMPFSALTVDIHFRRIDNERTWIVFEFTHEYQLAVVMETEQIAFA